MSGIATLLLALLLPASRADLATVDLNTKYGECAARIPALDQGHNGTCYAYGVSAYVAFSSCKEGRSAENIDPNWIAYVTASKVRDWPQTARLRAQEWTMIAMGSLVPGHDHFDARAEVLGKILDPELDPKSDLEGGSVVSAVRALKSAGACPHSVSKQIERDVRDRYSLTLNEYIHLVTTAFGGAQAPPPTATTLATHLREDGKSFVEAECLGTRLLDDFRSIAEAKTLVLNALTPIKVFDELFAPCLEAGRKALGGVPDLIPFVTYNNPAQGGIKIVDELNAGFPALATVCGEILQDPARFGKFDAEKQRLHQCRLPGGVSSRHLVAITAFSEIQGKPAFLIRNSWGPAWNPPHALACACNVEVSGSFPGETSRASMVVSRHAEYHAVCPKQLMPNEKLLGYAGCWFPRDKIEAGLTQILLRK